MPEYLSLMIQDFSLARIPKPRYLSLMIQDVPVTKVPKPEYLSLMILHFPSPEYLSQGVKVGYLSQGT